MKSSRSRHIPTFGGGGQAKVGVHICKDKRYFEKGYKKTYQG